MPFARMPMPYRAYSPLAPALPLCYPPTLRLTDSNLTPSESKPRMNIQLLTSRDCNKAARAALQTSNCVFLSPLPDGRWALMDRAQFSLCVFDSLPTKDEIRGFLQQAATIRMANESRFWGEPSTHELAADIRDSYRPIVAPRAKTQAIEIEL